MATYFFREWTGSLSAVGVLCGFAAGGVAQDAPDQSFELSNAANAVHAEISNETSRSQTMQVGTAGTLSKFELFITRGAEDDTRLGFAIQKTTAGGAPDDAGVLFSGNISGVAVPSASNGQINLGISGLNIKVDEGDVIAMSISRASDNPAIWRGESGDPYPRGGSFVKPGAGGAWTPVDGVDLGFRLFILSDDGGTGEQKTILYPTANGIALIDFGTGSSKSISYGGNGPNVPLSADVDFVLTPDVR